MLLEVLFILLVINIIINYSTFSISDVKKKALPLWIREGLEKLEKNKQKKQTEEGEQNKSKLNLSGSSSSISGYDHGKVNSPVHSPKSNQSEEVCLCLCFV